MDRKDDFSTDDLSEDDRISALNKIIHEFLALNGDRGSEFFHKRRQLLLNIWGDLVLARKDPAEPTIPETEPAENKTEEFSVLINEDTVSQEIDNHLVEGHSSGEPPLEENHASLQEPNSIEDIDASSENLAEEPLINLQLIGHHESETEPNHKNAEASLDHEIDVEGAASKLEDLTEDHELNDPVHENPSHLITEAIDADHLQNIVNVSFAEDQATEPAALLIAASDEKSEIEFVIQNLHSEETMENSSTVTITSNEGPSNDVLAKIFDVQNSEQKPLIEIMDVEEDPDQILDIASIKDEISSGKPAALVRLRLLKTGVLHDMVLPEGTIVSTNLADAEELIASGTAERLLIQSDDEDDDL